MSDWGGITGWRALRLGLLLGAWLQVTPGHAFQRVDITPGEYERWPYYCQAAPHTKVTPPAGFQRPHLSDEDKAVSSAIGIWHYCIGYIKIQRAELYRNSDRGKELLASMGRDFADLRYSFDKIDKSHPWAAEMAITLARGYRLVGKSEQALALLQQARARLPDYPLVYSVISSIYFDQGDYPKAAEVLEEGNRQTGGENPELNYFLGLAYAYDGQLDKAKRQAEISRELGYPLSGLDNKIRRMQAQ